MASVFPARTSTGIVLPMLMFGDIFAVGYYRRNAARSHLIRLMPWTVAGIVIGYLALGRIDDCQLRPLIGITILAMLGADFWRSRRQASVPIQWWFIAGIGIVPGITTMMANAAGPIMTIYHWPRVFPRLSSSEPGAWYYVLLDWLKVPFSLSLGLTTYQSLQFDVLLFPLIAIGTVIGLKTIKHIAEKTLSNIARILAIAAATNLLL